MTAEDLPLNPPPFQSRFQNPVETLLLFTNFTDTSGFVYICRTTFSLTFKMAACKISVYEQKICIADRKAIIHRSKKWMDGKIDSDWELVKITMKLDG